MSNGGIEMDKQELLSLAEQQTEELKIKSQNMTYLKDFTKIYNEWRQQASKITKTKEEYLGLIHSLDNIIDKAIYHKLVQAHTDKIDEYISCMPDSKSFIDNKYVRYKIFDTCAYLVRQSDAYEFLEVMKTIYFKTKSLYRGFASTDDYIKPNKNLVDLIRNSVK